MSLREHSHPYLCRFAYDRSFQSHWRRSHQAPGRLREVTTGWRENKKFSESGNSSMPIKQISIRYQCMGISRETYRLKKKNKYKTIKHRADHSCKQGQYVGRIKFDLLSEGMNVCG